MRILVVEDNALLADILTAFLQMEGHVAHFEGDGLAALTYLDAPSVPLPEVIVLDLKMPGMGGEDFLDRIHERQAWASIPVILSTAASVEEQSRVREHWPRVQVLAKPYDPEVLVGLLNDLEVEQRLAITREGKHV